MTTVRGDRVREFAQLTDGLAMRLKLGRQQVKDLRRRGLPFVRMREQIPYKKALPIIVWDDVVGWRSNSDETHYLKSPRLGKGGKSPGDLVAREVSAIPLTLDGLRGRSMVAVPDLREKVAPALRADT
jgi:hypothetical protein